MGLFSFLKNLFIGKKEEAIVESPAKNESTPDIGIKVEESKVEELVKIVDVCPKPLQVYVADSQKPAEVDDVEKEEKKVTAKDIKEKVKKTTSSEKKPAQKKPSKSTEKKPTDKKSPSVKKRNIKK